MIKAVVYTSQTGFTAKYAAMLSEELGVPVYPLDKASSALGKNDKIAYLGWIMGGNVKDIKKASVFDLAAVCAVGMARPTPEERERMAKLNSMHSTFKPDSFFLLQGGFDMNKLTGIYRFMMKIMAKAMSKGLTKKIEDGTATESEKEMLEMTVHSKDCTSKEALIPVIEYIKANA